MGLLQNNMIYVMVLLKFKIILNSILMVDILEKKLNEKQVVYVKLIPRMFTSMLDIYIFALVSLYPIAFISRKIFLFMFKESILKQNININNKAAIDKLLSSQDFLLSIPSGIMIESLIILGLIQFLIFSCYFIFFWHKFATSPVKFLFGIKVLDSVTMSNLSIKSCIKRIFGLFTSPIGLWSIIVTKKHQALHDKIAGSIVVKK